MIARMVCYSIIGYDLAKTLSEHGTVNRGVCEVDKHGNLISVQNESIFTGKEIRSFMMMQM